MKTTFAWMTGLVATLAFATPSYAQLQAASLIGNYVVTGTEIVPPCDVISGSSPTASRTWLNACSGRRVSVSSLPSLGAPCAATFAGT